MRNKKDKKPKGILSEDKISKKYNSGRADVIGITPENILRIPSRIIKLNYQLNGGPAYGKILEEFGEESTGKSMLAMDLAYSTIALGGEVIWADVENSFDMFWFEQNGLDLSKIHLLTKTTSMEIVSDWCQDMCKAIRYRLIANEPILFVLDSIAAVRCSKEIEESAVDASAKYGNRAKAISDFLGNRNEMFARLGITVILINQLRKKIGASKFEDPDKTVGGEALKFYAHQRIGIVRGKQIKAKVKGHEFKAGQHIYIRTKKDKTGPPRETTETNVFFRNSPEGEIGFDRYAGLPELLVSKGIIQRAKGQSRYYYKDKMLAHGEDKLDALLREDSELRSKLIRKAKINTISKTQRQLDETTENLYPIKLSKQKEEDGE